jgi:oxygen-independent coproporphyrinogen-3 oxidase
MLTREAYQRLQAACPQLPALPRKAFRIRTRVLDGRSRFAGEKSLSQLSFRLEFLSAVQAAAEDLMLGARLTSGIGAELIAAASEVLGEGRVAAQLSTLVSEELLKQCGKAYVPTKNGWLLGNELFGALWDLAEDQRTQTIEVRP